MPDPGFGVTPRDRYPGAPTRESFMAAGKPQHAWAAIAAVTVLNLPLGSIYAFSVFLKPIEAELGIHRSEMSLVFGLASVGFTVGMLLAPYVFGRISIGRLIAVCGAAAVVGIGLSAMANGLVGLLIGYSVLFGLGGGAAYIVAQQSVNMLVTRNKGLVNGYIVGLYPAGAMISAPLFGWANAAFGYRTTLTALSGVLLLSTVAAIGLLTHAGAALPPPGTVSASAKGRTAIFVRMWTVFFVAAAAGLTVLSQAAGIIAAYGGNTALALAATTGITGAIAVARLSGGMADGPAPRPLCRRLRAEFRSGGGHRADVIPLPHGRGDRAGDGRDGIRVHLRRHGRRDRRLLAARGLRPHRQPIVYRLVSGGGDAADPGGAFVRSHAGIRHDRHHRRLRQPDRGGRGARVAAVAGLMSARSDPTPPASRATPPAPPALPSEARAAAPPPHPL